MKRSTVTAAAVALPVLFAVTSCASETVCPAIGYSSTLTITVVGDADESHELEVCFDDNCVTSDSADHESMPSDTNLQRTGAAEWQLVLFADPPSAVEVRVLDEQGSVVADQDETLNWSVTEHPYGEQCGGPAEARLTLEL